MKIVEKTMFALYGTWGPLVVGKILARGVGTICPPGEYHSETKNELFVCCPSDARTKLRAANLLIRDQALPIARFDSLL